MPSALLEIKNLQTHFRQPEGIARVVDGVSLHLKKGQTLALVGESGCGKTMTAYSILRLVPSPPGSIVGGSIFFKGEDILRVSEKKMRAIRGNSISMIFQEPLTSLNPVFRVGAQIAEVLQEHRRMKKKAACAYAQDLLQDVGIASPEQRIRDYPHQMSGGMRQRIMIAMALACEPDLLIADEPTTALDVTVQAQIMDLLDCLQKRRNMALLLITHDLGLVAEWAMHVAVMYAGRIMEYTEVARLFSEPLNPYTRGLIDSLPGIDGARLKPIRGMVPSLVDVPRGCKFSTRCDHAFDKCMQVEPDLRAVQSSGGVPHLVRCWLYQE